jgi:hypothetical protein
MVALIVVYAKGAAVAGGLLGLGVLLAVLFGAAILASALGVGFVRYRRRRGPPGPGRAPQRPGRQRRHR